MNERKQSVRIQTSILSSLERKTLTALARKQPKWVTSDMLTFIGTFGAIVIALGYILTNINLNYLWLSSLGYVINWYGDSLDGSLARYRNQQRPVYGFYLDHTMDAINELIMFAGAGLSVMMRQFPLAMMVLVLYLMLTLNVTVNAHLKGEFKLTYAKLGPTELRIIMILANTLLVCLPSLATFSTQCHIFGREISLGLFDILAAILFVGLTVIYLATVVSDARYYAKIDPLPKKDSEKE